MSIRLRLALLISISMLMLLLLGVYAGSIQKRLQAEREDIRTRTSDLIHATDTINNHFQDQLLAWSNLLLRGQNAEQYYVYLQKFYQQERDTRKEINNLLDKLAQQQVAYRVMNDFNNAHISLGVRYRKALQIFNQADEPAEETDRFVWNAVDNPVLLLDEVKTHLLVHRNAAIKQAENTALLGERNILLASVVLVVATLFAALWFINAHVGRPMEKVVTVAKLISSGGFQQRINNDESGEFAVLVDAINHMLDKVTESNVALENKVQELNDEVQVRKQAEQQLEQKKIDAEQASRAKSEFLSNISHEIRTPLNVVSGYAELLELTSLDEKQQSYIKSIKSGSTALLSIINDILDMSKIEAGKLRIDMRPIDLLALLSDIEMMFFPVAMKKGLEYKVHLDKAVPARIIMDDLRLRQILINLLNNAIKFTESGYVLLEVNAEYVSSYRVDLVFSVKDSGIGITEKFHEKVFDSFSQQEGQDSRSHGGTGLGLAISNKLAGLLNGELELTSSQQDGSTFTLYLRQVEFVEVDMAGEINSPALEQKFAFSTILVVDDIRANRQLVCDYLESQAFDFVQAENGRQAIDAARQHKPDVIFMDIKMPEMDGVEATRLIKQDEQLKHIPVIALTASAISDEEKEERRVLFDDYLVKPIKRNLLFGSLEKFIKHEKPG